jgi:hypothetical protein
VNYCRQAIFVLTLFQDLFYLGYNLIFINAQGGITLLYFGADRQAYSEKGKDLSIFFELGSAPEEQYRSECTSQLFPGLEIVISDINFAVLYAALDQFCWRP